MLRTLSVVVLCALVALAAPTTAAAQAQAANGNIEGIVKDTTGAALPGVTVTVTNMDTGTARTSVTNDEGVYRAILLPLGRYRVVAELQGFKTFEQQGITLSAGQTALINIQLGVGSVSETVTVTSESPVAQPGKIDLGRTIGENEIKNLPLISRNPYNFAFLQANVTGFENNEFGVPRINANGTQMRTNYQIDGNTNTEKDRAGLRLLPVSEVLVREVKVITNGFAPEFGQTTGMVYNAITPSGTNSSTARRASASAGTTCRRARSSSRRRRASRTPKSTTSRSTLGGPVVKDKWHYYGAYEFVDRSLITGNQVITVDAVGGADARADPAGGRRDSRAPEGQLPVWQDRLSDQPRESAVGPVFPLQELLALEHRRRPDDHRPRDRLHRPHGFRVGAARVDDRERQAERAARPVRAPAPVPDAGRHGRRRCGDHGDRRGEFRRAAHRRHQLGRLRFQPGHLAGHREPDLDSRQARLQGRHRRAVHRRRPRARRALLLHVPDQRRLPRRAQRGQRRSATPRCSRTSAISRRRTTRRSTASSSRTTGS